MLHCYKVAQCITQRATEHYSVLHGTTSYCNLAQGTANSNVLQGTTTTAQYKCTNKYSNVQQGNASVLQGTAMYYKQPQQRLMHYNVLQATARYKCITKCSSVMRKQSPRQKLRARIRNYASETKTPASEN